MLILGYALFHAPVSSALGPLVLERALQYHWYFNLDREKVDKAPRPSISNVSSTNYNQIVRWQDLNLDHDDGDF